MQFLNPVDCELHSTQTEERVNQHLSNDALTSILYLLTVNAASEERHCAKTRHVTCTVSLCLT